MEGEKYHNKTSNKLINDRTLGKIIDPQLAPTTPTQETLTRVHRGLHTSGIWQIQNRENAQKRTPGNSGVE